MTLISLLRTVAVALILSTLIAPASQAQTYTVRDVQSWLTQLGYNPGPVDGSYGRRTAEALTNFYKAQGKQFDGTLDENEFSDIANQITTLSQSQSWQLSSENSRYFIDYGINDLRKIPSNILPSGPIPQWDSSGKVSPGRSDNREIVIINENFKVDRGETVIFNNKIVKMIASGESQSQIVVKGNLVFENSLIIWDQKFNRQVELNVASGGFLTIKNSFGWASGPANWWSWNYTNGSKILLDRAYIDVWTTGRGSIDFTARNFSLARITLFDDIRNSKIRVEDSPAVDFELFTPQGSEIDISVPPGDSWVNWELNDFFPNTSIQILDSRIALIALTLNNRSDLTLRNNNDVLLGMNIVGGEGKRRSCEIDNFGIPFVPDRVGSNDGSNNQGEFVQYRKFDIDCNNSSFTAINSRLVGFFFHIQGNLDLLVTNSRLVDPTNGGCGANVIIRNSTLNLLRTWSGNCGNQSDSGRSYIANSEIRMGVDAQGSRANVWLWNTKIGGMGYSETGLVAIDGAKISQIQEDHRPW